MNLSLNRPLAVFDIETTGLDIIKDRIIEIYILKIQPDKTTSSLHLRINPQMPIPPHSTAIHGITDADLKDCPIFADVVHEINNFLRQCDLSGFNAQKFDIPFLDEEFARAKVSLEVKKRKIVDVMNIFFKMEPRNLEAAYRFYCNKELENAHSAEADVLATFEVLKAQLDKYEKLEKNIDFLSEFSSHNKNADLVGRIIFDEKGEEVFNFGKHKGKKVADVLEKEPSYYSWMMNGSFPESTKSVLTEIRLRKLGK